MAQLTDIPNEITLEFFAQLPLKALIAARGVNQRWRHLVLYADIFPARRELLCLYLKIIESPLFIPTRGYVMSALEPFDRQGYLDALLKDHPFLPEEFSLWVLEWPSRAAIHGSWPGLPVFSWGGVWDEVERFAKSNMLGSIPPHVSTLRFGENPPYEYIPALCLWTADGIEFTWLVLDERDGLRGKVYDLCTDVTDLLTEDGSNEFDVVDANFIDWQKRLWEQVEWHAAYNATDAAVDFLAFRWQQAEQNALHTRKSSKREQRSAVPRIPGPPWRMRHDPVAWSRAISKRF